jgi:hypothetical protein
MTTKMFSVGISVDPATTSSLSIRPASVNLTLIVGAEAPSTPIAFVSGGVPPYTCTPSAGSASLPAGITFAIDKSGNLYPVGTPTTEGTTTEQVLLDVSDSAGGTLKMAVSPKGQKKVWGQ